MSLFNTLLSQVFCSKQENDNADYKRGAAYAREQLALHAGNEREMERLEAESLGWEGGHPFDRGMSDVLSAHARGEK